MSDKPKIRRFSRNLVVDGVAADAVVVHPEGGNYALDTVDVTRPSRVTIRLKPRRHSHETLDGIDDELRKDIGDLDRS